MNEIYQQIFYYEISVVVAFHFSLTVQRMCHTSVQVVRESWVSSGVLLLSLVEEEEVTLSMTLHLLVAQQIVMYHQQKQSQEVVGVVMVEVMVTEKCS